ncbi:MAG: ABC transporter substrate-binding protein [Gammaproteobacteria bacterium]|nr:ABC transporter substrate-binding protein [Gammaproteobacteria bacterium]MCP5426246.1 ABC transporter substrate-binding protein [Gammaproteobacteria bacterium]
MLLLVWVAGVISPAFAGEPQPMHGVAMHGDLKYGPDFTHFEYADPNAPKGGEVRLAAVGGFDSFNPYIVKGQPAAGLGFLFESLMTSSADEAFSEYGLIAESIEMPDDRSWVIFNLRPQARFHDGSAITADDVIFSFDILKTKGRPLFRFYYANVEKVEKLAEQRVKFTFAPGENRELALIIGQLPILSKQYWEGRDFDATTLEPPIGSGPYRIKQFETGRFVVYELDENYWGKDLPVNRGIYNFGRMRYDYYRDTTVALEAFKAGAYDLRPETSAKDWATAYDFPAVRNGLVKTERFPHQMPSGMQGFAYNLRRPLFQDDRVRQALAYAFDFEWSNRNLFYGQYTRTRSYFDNSELASRGLPSKEELVVLEPLRAQIPPEVFTETYAPPVSDSPEGLRANLRKALDLLQAAGWVFKDRKLVNGQTGQPFEFEILLNQPNWERITLPFTRNLERLGINTHVRTVDSAQYENRLNNFDYDMIVDVWGQSLSPGNEQREFWGSHAADAPGSRNTVGIKNPAIDQLIESVIAAPDRQALLTCVHAMDRVLLWNHYVIPHWHIPYERLAFWDKFGRPALIPMQGVQINAWWVDPAKAATLGEREKTLKAE